MASNNNNVKKENSPFKQEGRMDNRRPPPRNDNRRPQHNNDNQWPRKDMVLEKLKMLVGPTNNLASKDTAVEKKFSGRCRLYAGNLPPAITDEQFNDMFKPFGETAEAFLNKQKCFGFIKLDTRQNAELAKAKLDSSTKDGRVIRVRFASHDSAIKVKNLGNNVSNELLETAFSVFGEVERAVVIVDHFGKTTNEGIVEFTRKQSAQAAIDRCTEGCFLITNCYSPVLVELYKPLDEDCGLPERNLQKHDQQYLKDREIGPRLTEPGSFEHEFSNRWKKLFEIERQKKEHLDKEIEDGRRLLTAQMDDALYEYETNLLRQRLRQMEEQNTYIQRERELRREEEIRREETRRQQEMILQQQREEILRNNLRRRQEENMGMGDNGMQDGNAMGGMNQSDGSGFGPPGMMQGPGMKMQQQRRSRFDQPGMGAGFSPSGDPMMDMMAPPPGPMGRGRMRGPPMPPHELVENVEDYGNQPKRQRY